MTEKTKKTGKTIVNIVLWIFLVFALAMTIFAFMAQSNSDGIPKIGDKCVLTVLSDSMAEPGGFYKGDVIISKALSDDEKKELKVGDVITFLADLTPEDGVDNKELNTHRIVQVETDSYNRVIYYTKGDHNPIQDTNPVIWTDVKAIWTGTRVAVVGSIITFLQSSTGFLVCIVIPLFLFFIYELYVFITVLVKIKNRGKKQITAADEELIKQRAVEEYLRQKAEAEKTAGDTVETVEKTEEPAVWTCPACGCKDITSKFCPDCGAKKP